MAAPSTPRWIFIGSGSDAGIYRAAWNPTTGALDAIELAAAAKAPNFLTLHPTLPVLYSANSSNTVEGFHLDPQRGSLTRSSELSSQGMDPCYISVDHTGHNLFVANYGNGVFAALGLGSAGELRAVTGVLACNNNPACGALGPVKARQESAHMHSATVSPENHFVLACNLGEDAIEVFPIAPGTPRPLGDPMRVPARTGSGPRHVAFHPNQRWVYCVHELDSTIDLYDWSASAGKATMKLRANSVVSTLARGVALSGNTGCEVVVSDDGRFLYTCTRGETSNSLIVYRIDAASGLLTEQQRLSCGGAIPRYITLDPSRRWLLCANQGSGNVTVFAHDPRTGRLNATAKSFAVPTPMFFQFV